MNLGVKELEYKLSMSTLKSGTTASIDAARILDANDQFTSVKYLSRAPTPSASVVTVRVGRDSSVEG